VANAIGYNSVVPAKDENAKPKPDSWGSLFGNIGVGRHWLEQQEITNTKHLDSSFIQYELFK
jgi:hypothetical protein